MIATPDRFAELGALVDVMADRELKPEEDARLEQLVADDISLRRYYLERVFLVGQLQWECDLAGRAATIALTGRTGGSQVLSVVDRLRKSPSLNGGGALGHGRRGWGVPHRRVGLSMAVAFGAMIGVLVVLAVWVAPSFRGRAGVEGPSAMPVARLSGAVKAKWRKGDRTLEIGDVCSQGEEIHLVEGLIEVEFFRGAKAVVEGPAVLAFSDANNGYLESGKLVAAVPRRAVGFCLDTPLSRVTDLGTEFGVIVEPSRAVDVFVYEGTVEVEPRGADSHLNASGTKRRLSAGQSLRVSSEGTVEPNTVAEPKQLVRHLPEGTGDAQGSDAYAQAVLASKPLAYWRFEETEGDWAVDSSGNGNDAEYGEKVWRGVRGMACKAFAGFESGNRAAGFPGKGYQYKDCVSARLARLPDEYSVELWMCNARPNDERDVTGVFFSRAANQRSDSVGDHLSIRGACTPMTAGHLACYNGRNYRASLVSRSALRPQQWYYVVFVRQDDNIRVFLDGEETPQISGPADYPLLPDSDRIHIGIRNNGEYSFCGRIDEVAIYDRPLSFEEIAGHYMTAIGAKVNEEKTSKNKKEN